jgi:MFS transporter, ACS family, hexuronate transporter
LIGAWVSRVGYDPFFIALGVLDLLGAVVLWVLVKPPQDQSMMTSEGMTSEGAN